MDNKQYSMLKQVYRLFIVRDGKSQLQLTRLTRYTLISLFILLTVCLPLYEILTMHSAGKTKSSLQNREPGLPSHLSLQMQKQDSEEY